MDYYYSPWQYELREYIGLDKAKPTVRMARAARVPDPVTATVFAGAVFLAYAPLLQPGPPAKTPSPGILPFLQVGAPGGGMIL